MMLFKKSDSKIKTYDKENQIPVLRCSICTGEQVAGFKDIHTGKFNDVTLIRNESELEKFMKEYGLSDITREY
ncbi:MAG: aspartate dehydrogenase [Lachnospiraceae bacterium]|nr:aspartate dehydrogenase [Lachnospiraceae bacterium]